MLDLSDFGLIIGGDFNAVWSHSLDRTGVADGANQRLASSVLRKWASDCAVVDVWRTANPSLSELLFLIPSENFFSYRLHFYF